MNLPLLNPELYDVSTDAEESYSAADENPQIYEDIRRRVAELHEANPMLGHRGCRLGISFPEISEMQVRAIFQAACDVKKDGIDARPEVMIPLVGTVPELAILTEMVRRVAAEVIEERGVELPVLVQPCRVFAGKAGGHRRGRRG